LEDTTQQALTAVSVAYAAMFYAAAAILLAALAFRVWRFIRHPEEFRVPDMPGPESHGPHRLEAATNLVLFRSTFFTDRINWIFSACFHFGLLLVVLRHLRYAINPDWVGPVWRLIMLVQPFGLYGGLVMIAGAGGYLARHVLVKEVRAATKPVDLFALILLLIIPIVGYANNLVHTDVVAVKHFFVGLALFHPEELPHDLLLLLHLWLVAVLVVILPFSDLLHMKGFFEKIAKDPSARRVRRHRIALAALALALLVPPAIGGISIADEGWTKPQPDFSKLARAHKNLDPTVMIRNHPNFLMHTRSIVVYEGKRTQMNTIEKCVDCHAVKGDDGQPVGYDDPKHFCNACHRQAAVTIDCFECHNSKPPAEESHAALETSRRLASLFGAAGSTRSAVR
jgi:nitrate reductase gamma subunit